MRKFIDISVTIIILIALVLAFVTGSGGIIQLSPPDVTYGEAGMDVSNGITNLIIVLLGIVTVIDLCQAFGLGSIVPSYITKKKRKTQEEAVKQVIDTYYGEDFSRYSELLEVYFKKDLAFVKSNQKARTDYIMQSLEIKRAEMLDGLIRLRAMPLASTQDAIDRMQHILQEMPDIIIQQQEQPADRTYKEVQFYIDFVSSMRDDEYGKELSKTFARYITLDMLEHEIKHIAKVIIPADSNFLLGFKVAECLNLPPVIMREKKGRIFEDQPWDGALSRDDRVIIVHDVLVSGNQIVSAMKKLKNYGVEAVAVYCIVDRLDYPGEKAITSEDSNCKVRAMLQLDDKIISKKYYNGGRKFRFPLKKLPPNK